MLELFTFCLNTQSFWCDPNLSLICNSFILIRHQDESFRRIFSSLTCVCVSSDVRPGVWPHRDDGLRRRESAGVWNVPGIQHGHLDCRSAAGNAHFTDSRSIFLWRKKKKKAVKSNIKPLGWHTSYFMDQTPCRPVQVKPLSICVCCFSRRWVVWS